MLSWELGELADALEAARMLSEAIVTEQLGPDHDRRHAPRALTAMLSITWARLRDLTRAVRGDMDPGQILTAYNDAGSSSLPEEIVLKAWDVKRRGAP